MAAGTDLGGAASACAALALLLAGAGAPAAAAGAADDEALLGGEAPGWHDLTELRLRVAVFGQRGRGFQSQDGPIDGAGREDALIVSPLALLRVRQSDEVRHEVIVPFDVVSAASPDALDAVSKASAVTESGGLDGATSYAPAGGAMSYLVRYGFSLEEPFRSFFAGLGAARSLAEDNARVELSGGATFDYFDVLHHRGERDGTTTRQTLNANLSLTQLLSPTTVVDGSYGVTRQAGTLETTYNSVPIDGPNGPARLDERLPGERLRHALSGRLAQHLPATRSTVKLAYRFYADSFDLVAHTAQLDAYQYLSPWLYVRATYRLHHQRGASFFATRFDAAALVAGAPRTSDSDLAPLDAHEVGLKLVLLGERAPPGWLRRMSLDLSYLRYQRTNDLAVDVVSLGCGRRF